MENARSLSRPLSQLKNVSSWAISSGPSLAISATFGVSSETFSMRALISMFRAMAGDIPHSSLEANAARGARQVIRPHRGVEREPARAIGRQEHTDEQQASRWKDSPHAAMVVHHDDRDREVNGAQDAGPARQHPQYEAQTDRELQVDGHGRHETRGREP